MHKSVVTLPEAIDKFQGEHRFLSNFYPATIPYDGLVFPSVEHAYQAAKARHRADRVRIQQAKTPGAAKRLGRQVEVRSWWWTDPAARIKVMHHLVRLKFVHNKDLAERLVATGDAKIIEGNEWGDGFWGVYRGEGNNHLGEILMRVREELRSVLQEER